MDEQSSIANVRKARPRTYRYIIEIKTLVGNYMCLERIEPLSDHALLTMGLLRPNSRCQFKFELGWLHHDGLHDLVKKEWEKPVTGRTPIQRWNKNMR